MATTVLQAPSFQYSDSVSKLENGETEGGSLVSEN